MTHDELLKRIESLAVAWAKPNYNANALRAVVELHKPVPEPFGVEIVCNGCPLGYGIDSSYPCPTIQAIEKELA